MTWQSFVGLAPWSPWDGVGVVEGTMGLADWHQRKSLPEERPGTRGTRGTLGALA